MQIFIKDENKIQSLDLVNPDTGIGWVEDFIEAGTRDEFEWDDEHHMYACDSENFQWWKKVVDDRQALEDKISELKEIHGLQAVYEVLSSLDNCNELEYEAEFISDALDEAFCDDDEDGGRE